MNKINKRKTVDEMRKEYDFSQLKGGVRGKYAKRFRAGNNLVRLEADVARIFDNDASVNEALRSLIKVAKSNVKVTH